MGRSNQRRLIRQGDVLLIPIEAAPMNVTAVERDQRGLVLAEGEATGHAHRILDESATLVTSEQAAELYLLVHGTDPVELIHDEHDTLLVPLGAYRVVRQREYAPETPRWVAD